MIAVIDLYRIADEHVPVNAALLYIISRQYESDEVHFYGEEKHILRVKSFIESKNLSLANVSWHTYHFQFHTTTGIRYVLKRTIKELGSLRKLSRKIKGTKTEHIFFLSLSSITNIFVKRFLFRKISTLITLHGDVEFIRLNNGFTRNFLGRCLRIAFRIKKKNNKYLVLDEVIKTNLLKTNLATTEEIIAIPHPCLFRNEVQNRSEHNFPIVFAHIGVASMEKQSFYFYRIAEKFEKEIQDNKIAFRIIGKNENILLSEMNDLVSGGNKKEFLSRSDFESEISNIDYVVFFYNDIYQLTGSGAIIDAIDLEKPIIAFKNELFNSFFETTGKMGYLCNNVEEMKEVISNILSRKNDDADHKMFQQNMKNFKKENSAEVLRKKLFTQL